MNPRLLAELNYQAARLTVQKMLDEGILSPASAGKLLEKFLKRYQPLIGGFLHEADVHTLNPTQKEAPHADLSNSSPAACDTAQT